MVANPIHHEPHDDELIAEYIQVDPDRGGIEDARLAQYGVPVWALVGYLPAGDGDWDDVARAYKLPLDAVQAAFAFYDRYRPIIDARIAANAFPDA